MFIKKLKWYGITDKTIDCINSFLSQRTQCFIHDGISFSKIRVTTSVPNGSVFSPCIFMFYINNVAQCINTTTRFFDDDDLHDYEEWDRCYPIAKRQINYRSGKESGPARCKIVTITSTRAPLQFSCFIHGQQLKHVDHTKYLGVIISSDFRWDKHIYYISTRENNTLNLFR